MINQIALFVMLLTPVMAYMAGGLVLSLIRRLRKGSIPSKLNNTFYYRNGL